MAVLLVIERSKMDAAIETLLNYPSEPDATEERFQAITVSLAE